LVLLAICLLFLCYILHLSLSLSLFCYLLFSIYCLLKWFFH
jgi:hypothetical protein